MAHTPIKQGRYKIESDYTITKHDLKELARRPPLVSQWLVDEVWQTPTDMMQAMADTSPPVYPQED